MVFVSVICPGAIPGLPRLLFEGRYILDSYPRYGVSPDGQRFLLSRVEGAARIKVMPNWLEELKGLVPAN